MTNYKITRYCECGSSIQISSSSKKTTEEIFAIFMKNHKSEGHKSVSARKAAKAREKLNGQVE